MRKVIVVVALLILAAALSLFLKVTRIEVSGLKTLDANAVVSAGRLAVGESLLFADTEGAEKRILAEFPYAESVSIHRKLPTTLRINLVESVSLAYIELTDGSCAKISDSGRVLEVSRDTENPPEGIHIIGIGEGTAKAGQIYEPTADETIRFGYCLEFLQAVNAPEGSGIIGLISYIDAGDLLDFKFDLKFYRGFTVYLGSREETIRKLGTLSQTLEKLGANDSGSIDLSVIGEAHLIPD
ncbi:MAG: FtsQ-type POTRA domain-containing protein [Oscillospiraceae bacterium]|jgi:hypothetical protein|nr:FtsQ-type POTRA domain-containing protein [Oscillospiraceae bacterium]